MCIRDRDSVTERTHIEKTETGARFTEDDGATWTDLSGDTVVSMNLWGFTPSFLKETEDRFAAFLDKALVENPLKGEYFLPSVVSQLIAEDKARVKVLHSHDKWYGVTSVSYTHLSFSGSTVCTSARRSRKTADTPCSTSASTGRTCCSI